MANKTINCPVEATLEVIGGKWKVLIIWHLKGSELRFGELRHRMPPSVTQQMLTQQLRELEADGVIHRQIFAQVPPRVEYSLTDFGRSLQPILHAMSQWGKSFLQEYDVENTDVPAESMPTNKG